MSLEIVNIKLQGKDYALQCTPAQRAQLQQAAAYLEEQIQALRKTSTVQSSEHILMLAAINMTHELLLLQQQHHLQTQNVTQHIQRLQNNVHTLLQNKE